MTQQLLNAITCVGDGKSKGLAMPQSHDEWLKIRRLESLGRLCSEIRNSSDKEKQKELKLQLPWWTPHCNLFLDNHRKKENVLQPLGRVTVDLDESKGRSREICQKALQLKEDKGWRVLLVEESPRGGTHIVLAVPEGKSAHEAASDFALDLGEKHDTMVLHTATCLFMTPESYILYMDKEGLELTSTPLSREEADRVWPTEHHSAPAHATIAKETENLFPTSCKGTPYQDIIDALQEELGGEPMEGERNNFLLKMAQHMAFITDKNPDHLAKILPHYGQNSEEFRHTIENACKYPTPLCYKYRMENLLDSLHGVCRRGQQVPQMPEEADLPPFIQAVVKGSPQETQPALALACFAPAACYTHNLQLVDASLRPTEVAFLVNVIGRSGVGKSSIDHPIQCIMASINEQDAVNRKREAKWKTEARSAGKNKAIEQRPEKLIIQNLGNNLTHAAYMMRMQLAEGHPLFIHTPELDALKALNEGKDPLSILRVMHDHAEYGQERSSLEADSIKVKLYTNIVAASTLGQARTFYDKGISKGNIGRLTIAIITKDEDDWGAEIPQYSNQSAEYTESLKPFLQALEQAHGTLHEPQAIKWQQKLQASLAAKAQEANDRIYQSLMGRAVTSGFWRAMMLYIMNGQQWSQEIENFCTWSVEYDLWCKMQVFGPQLRREWEKENLLPVSTSGSVNFDTLPAKFTKTDIHQLYQAQGKTAKQADNTLAQWKRRGKIILIDSQKQMYLKK